jgi:single-strand DNA-binding protein
MARGVNRVTLIGNLGSDPELRTTGGGSSVCSFSLATSESWTDKQSGEKQERTEWHRIKIFGRLGEIAGEYLKKGRQVYIEGSIRTDKFTGKDGVEKYFTDIIANEMQMLGGQEGAKQDKPQQRQERAPSRDSSYGDAAKGGFEDDEIPFAPIQRRAYW